MDLKTIKGCNVEIVSPAGNLEKLKIAVKYGADAVYFGGEEFNLRDRAGNFTAKEIEEGLEFCAKNNARTIFLLNSFLHENQISSARAYIDRIKDFNFSAVMISDPGMLMLVKEAGFENIHLSTQMSTLNHLAAGFWKEAGIKRIVLARETTLDEIKKIRDNTDIEIEIFVHGALCISYSGRCLLSRFLSGRDANLGSCSHPCRWNFALVEEQRQDNHLEIIEHSSGTEILSSKDLCLIEKISEYITAGVNAFKIEGRMKSLYHTANVTRIYKHAVQQVLHNNKNRTDFLPFYKSELDLVSHRPYTDDLFNEFGNMGFGKIPYIKKVLFLGYGLPGGNDKNEILVKIFNPIYKGEKVEAIYPINDDIKDAEYQVAEITNNEEKPVDMARPGGIYRIRFNANGADSIPAITGDNPIFRRKL